MKSITGFFCFSVLLFSSWSFAGPIDSLKQSLKDKVLPYEVQYLNELAGLQVISCELVEVNPGTRLEGPFSSLTECALAQVFDQLWTGEQRVAILADLKFLRSPEQQQRKVLIRWTPVQIQLKDMIPSGEPGMIVAFLMRLRYLLQNLHDTHLIIRTLDGSVPLSWLVDDASPFRTAFVGLAVQGEEPSIERLELSIKTQKPGESSVTACADLKKLPESMKRMCAELKVYGEGSEQPGLVAQMEYGWRKSAAQIDENRDAIERRLTEVVNSGAQLYWPPPSSQQIGEMATRATPESFDAEFRFSQQ